MIRLKTSRDPYDEDRLSGLPMGRRYLDKRPP